MPSAFRSKVKEIMKQHRSGDLLDPQGLGTKPFENRFAAKKYAFESAKAGLSKAPDFYDERLKLITKRAERLGKEETPTKPAEPVGGDEIKPKGRKMIKLQKKARRMKRRGMNDVYDVQGIEPYKEKK